MDTRDVDPKFGLPLWWEVVHHYRKYPPLVQVDEQFGLPLAQPDQAAQAGYPPRWLSWLAVAGLVAMLLLVSTPGAGSQPGPQHALQHYGQY
ncbi:MAG TPA: hypothetical protein VF651_01680 [Gammaproteobacteria bacterium]